MSPEVLTALGDIAPMVVAVTGFGVGGWVITTWMRIRNGYPLENSWGKPIYPQGSEEKERIRLLTQENAQLHAELGSIKDRLANVERIVTDGGYALTHQIEALRDNKTAN